MLFNFIFYFNQTNKIISDLIKKERPSLIYLNTIALLTPAIAAKKNNIPLVWSIREVPGQNKILREWHLNKIKKLSDHILVTSEYVKNYFVETKNISVLYNSININDYKINKQKYRNIIRQEFGIQDGDIVICTIGNAQKVKGHYLLIESAKEVLKTNQNVRFLIIAGGVSNEYMSSWKGKIPSGVTGFSENFI